MIEKQPIWRQAASLGAVVEHAVKRHTTHLITTQPQTAKAKACFSMKSVFVVHPDWLMNSLWSVKRMDERNFSMGMLPVLDPAPFLPELCSTDQAGSPMASVVEVSAGVFEKEKSFSEDGNVDGLSSKSESGEDDEWVKSMEDEMNDIF